MPETTEQLWEVRRLLREGKVQQADDLITQHFAEEELVEDKADLAPPVKPPRTPEIIIGEILTALVMLHGNPPHLVELVGELLKPAN